MPYKVVTDFENRIAEFAGSKYAVAVESCSAALFLSCLYKRVGEVRIPKRTYPSVPCSIIHAGGKVKFGNEAWYGTYELAPYGIVDGALRFRRRMYRGGLHCLSFHIKKLLPIGRGGMVLTDDHDADRWLRLARFDGREPVPLAQDNFTMLGWNMYMTPDQAARGIQLFELTKDRELPDLRVEDQGYPDLSQYGCYRQGADATAGHAL
jgi:dTDP-4-amino-4,6-dideoxygalactose transaminase